MKTPSYKCTNTLSKLRTTHVTPLKTKVNPVWGSLKGKLVYISPSFDKPLGDKEWTNINKANQ